MIEFNNSSLNSVTLDELTVYYQQILDTEDHSSDTIYQLYDSEYILKLSDDITDQMGVLLMIIIVKSYRQSTYRTSTFGLN